MDKSGVSHQHLMSWHHDISLSSLSGTSLKNSSFSSCFSSSMICKHHYKEPYHSDMHQISQLLSWPPKKSQTSTVPHNFSRSCFTLSYKVTHSPFYLELLGSNLLNKMPNMQLISTCLDIHF